MQFNSDIVNSRIKSNSETTPRQPSGKKLFSFAVVADTHVNEDDHVCASPFATNAKANARARYVFRDIAALRPQVAFVIHLGDIVHPVPALPGFDQAARQFKEMASVLPMPLYLIPGNHDVGDKRIDWMPADVVCDEYLTKYRQTFGNDYYAVDANGLRFLFLNSLLFNSSLPKEQEQMEWLDRQLASAPGRVFISLHYPPYLLDRDEKGSYDNIDEPGRSWLLERMAHPQVEAVFAGHVHNFWYDNVGNAELYMLPSTAFLRHDFSEFYRIPPQEEYGRGDLEKFGYFIVDVYERGHVAQLVRTHGRQSMKEAKDEPRIHRWLTHAKTSSAVGFAAEMRHPWAEVVEIPCTGGVQEFGRKAARNDYSLMAMWEMGLRTIKIPLQDLTESKAVLWRAVMMSQVGHGFIVTCLDCPAPHAIEQAARAGVRMIGLELNLSQHHLPKMATRLQSLRQASDAWLIFSKIRTSDDDAHFDGHHYSHFVNTGMRLTEIETASWLHEALESRLVDGYTVRLDWGSDILVAHASLMAHAAASDCTILASVKLAHQLAQANNDDYAIAIQVAKAYLASRCSTSVCYALDTFMDVDRGYFPRNGLIDRRYDPRPAARILAALNALLPHGPIQLRATGTLGAAVQELKFDAGGLTCNLLTGPARTIRTLRLQQYHDHDCVDLLEDEIENCDDGICLVMP